MQNQINWGKLVSQGRAKGQGISWSDEEMQALVMLCKVFSKQMSEIAPYIRKGILTIEGYKKSKGDPGIVNPILKLPKDELIKKAQALGVSVSTDATVETLAEVITEEEKKGIASTSTATTGYTAPKEKKKVVEKKAPVKKEPVNKPKAKPIKKK